MHFFAEPPFRPKAKSIAHQEHPDQQFRIERRATRVAIKVCEMRADATQVYEPINRPQQMILRDVVLQRELVK
jgi:hypothetical protein